MVVLHCIYWMTVCRGGRPKLDILTFLINAKPFSEYWPATANPTMRLQDIGRNCSQHCIIYRLCRHHTAYIQPKSVFDNFASGKGT